MPATGPVVVSGVTGFVGGALARRLIRDGEAVIALVRPGRAEPAAAAVPGARIVEWDGRSERDLASLFALARPAVVYNAAAYGVKPGAREVWPNVRGNIDYPVALLLAAAGSPGCRFVHVGSCFEYGGGRHGRRLAEHDPALPFSVYGSAKLAATQIVRNAAADLGIDAVVARLFAVYGPGESDERLVPTLIRALRTGDSVPLTAGGQARDWLFLDDAIDALLACGDPDSGAVPGEVYNVCSANAVTVRQLGDMLARVTETSSERLGWGRLPYRPREPMWIVGDNSRFYSATGWLPRVGLEEGLRLTARSARGRVASESRAA